MPTVLVNGAPLHYEEVGDGPPLLLVHGILGTGRLHLRHQFAELACRFRAVLPDLRGYGESGGERDTSPAFYQRDAADMGALLDALGLAPAHYLGFSDGGLSGLILAAIRPEAVQSLIVLGVQRRLMPEDRPGWETMRVPETWDTGVQARTDAAHPHADWRAVSRALPATWERILADGGDIVGERIAQVRCPTLIIHGAADNLVPVAHAHDLHAAIPGSELLVVPGAGHIVQRDGGELVRTAIWEFYRRHAGVTPPVAT